MGKWGEELESKLQAGAPSLNYGGNVGGMDDHVGDWFHSCIC